MKNHLSHIILLLKRISLVYIAFIISRLLFLIFNYSYFSDNSFLEFLNIFAVGSFFDGISIIAFNFIFIVLHLIPFNFRNKNWYQKTLLAIFVIVNSIIILSNFTDIEYFKFTNKRTTFDVFSLMFLGDDMSVLLPQFIKDFWFLIVLWVATISLTVWLYPKQKVFKNTEYSLKGFIYNSIITIMIVSAFIFIARGTGLRPIGIANAARYTKSDNIPLLLNTPFTILKTINKKDLKEVHIYNETELKTIFNPIKQYKTDSVFRNMNVVIIILESFGKDYTGYYNKQEYTPFLDSLITQSLSFKNSYANGKKSMEAVPAIISSLPALTDNPYILSQYSTDNTFGIAEVLKSKGYYTSFFHGGSNGTMGFDNYALANGFDEYIGKNEYPNKDDYDGTWGIYDEAFLQFFAKKLDESEKPFLSAVFTLSSHHPYNIPEKYKDKFKEGSLPIHRSIAYADYSLKKFFETAKTMDWFDNTLFILSADHTSYTESAFYGNKIGMYNIPILYYAPDKIAPKESNRVTQQIDIMPSVLDFLNYNDSVFAFGNSVFSEDSLDYSVNYISGVYQYIKDGYTYLYDGDSSLALYNTNTDKYLKHNLLKAKPNIAKQMNRDLEAIIQTYNNSILNNKLTVEGYLKE